MEELQSLVHLINSLPTMGYVVLIGFFIYKLSILASIYGTIRFVAQKLHDMHVARLKKDQEVTLLLDGMPFDDASSKAAFIQQLQRLRFIGTPDEHASYRIHLEYGVKKLREAIDRIYEDEEKARKA